VGVLRKRIEGLGILGREKTQTFREKKEKGGESIAGRESRFGVTRAISFNPANGKGGGPRVKKRHPRRGKPSWRLFGARRRDQNWWRQPNLPQKYREGEKKGCSTKSQEIAGGYEKY